MRSWSAVTLVFFTSGAVLVLEILAGRLVAPYVGVSLETYTGVIGIILAGIAAGAAIGGRLADCLDPRTLLGPTLVLGGVLAWLILPAVDAVGPTVGPDPYGILVVTSFGFLLPAMVLSAVSPMVAKLRLADLGETGAVVGGLAAAGTAGALVGTFATGFVLIAAIPTRAIVGAVGTALVLWGAVVWFRLVVTAAARVALVVALVMLVPVGAYAVASEGPCDEQTQYFCARVEPDPSRPSGRTLWLDTTRHSYVDLDDPTHLGFGYTRQFAAVTDATMPAGPIDVLHVGGGGFTFPRYLAATRPGTTNRVLEIDEELVDLAERELGLVQGPGLRVETGDARLTIVDEPDGRYELVVGDAFGGLSVPWHLTTTEMVQEIARVLQPGGVYLMNVVDGDGLRFARAEVATLREVFDHVALIVPQSSRGLDGPPVNIVLVASDAPIPPIPTEAGQPLLTGAALDELVGDARPLTDDFAPVDQLVTLH